MNDSLIVNQPALVGIDRPVCDPAMPLFSAEPHSEPGSHPRQRRDGDAKKSGALEQTGKCEGRITREASADRGPSAAVRAAAQSGKQSESVISYPFYVLFNGYGRLFTYPLELFAFALRSPNILCVDTKGVR